VLLASGQVACWGDDEFLELGRGPSDDGGSSDNAQLVVQSDGQPFSGVMSLASGGYHTCALRNDGSVWCWGDNRDGQTAPGDTTSRSFPSPVTF
jgi:alpha-tubulin suppressor-like RCC1 family protein